MRPIHSIRYSIAFFYSSWRGTLKTTTLILYEDKQELLTQETVELLTSPLELAEYKSAIMEAMFKGTKRNVESENNSKNAHGRGTQVP